MRITIVTNGTDSQAFRDKVHSLKQVYRMAEEITYHAFIQKYAQAQETAPELVLLNVPQAELGGDTDALARRVVASDPPSIYQAWQISGYLRIPTLACIEGDQSVPHPGQATDWLVAYLLVEQLTPRYVQEFLDLLRAGLMPSTFTVDWLIQGMAKSEKCDFHPPELRIADRELLHHEFPR